MTTCRWLPSSRASIDAPVSMMSGRLEPAPSGLGAVAGADARGRGDWPGSRRRLSSSPPRTAWTRRPITSTVLCRPSAAPNGIERRSIVASGGPPAAPGMITFSRTIRPKPAATVAHGDGAAELRRQPTLAKVRRQPAGDERIEDQQDQRHAPGDAGPAVRRHERARAPPAEGPRRGGPPRPGGRGGGCKPADTSRAACRRCADDVGSSRRRKSFAAAALPACCDQALL